MTMPDFSFSRGAAAFVALMLLALPTVAATDPAGFVRITPDQLVWQEVPDGFGSALAVVQGDPSKPGLYIVRAKFPPHVIDRPHFHAEDRLVTVISGTWYAGTGTDWDPAKAVAMKPGSYMKHPAGAAHWDGSVGDEEVIVQVMGYGPTKTTLVDSTKNMWVKLQ